MVQGYIGTTRSDGYYIEELLQVVKRRMMMGPYVCVCVCFCCCCFFFAAVEATEGRKRACKRGKRIRGTSQIIDMHILDYSTTSDERVRREANSIMK